LFARTIFEGNKQFTSEPWDSMWRRSPNFRRGWRISAVIWGIGLLIDAVIRVIIAYSLPVDVVPAVATALFPVTAVVLIVIDQVNQHYNGIRGMLLGHGPSTAGGDDHGTAPAAGDVTASRRAQPRSPGTGSSPVR
jgi:hypothetical protein